MNGLMKWAALLGLNPHDRQTSVNSMCPTGFGDTTDRLSPYKARAWRNLALLGVISGALLLLLSSRQPQ